MNLEAARLHLRQTLERQYEVREANNIAWMVMEAVTGYSRSAFATEKERSFTISEAKVFNRMLQDLAAGQPIQYVLGEAWFDGMKFQVNPAVLIPRPETEELIAWIRSDFFPSHAGTPHLGQKKSIRILDIGTGSGCIAVSLARMFQESRVWAMDISEDALDLAKQNALRLGARVEFLIHDILQISENSGINSFDLIVSNPPYISPEERKDIASHVLLHEPHLALFTAAGDPLQFYRAILRFAHTNLRDGGALYMECHMRYAQDIVDLCKDSGLFTEILLRNDMQGLPRMVRANR